MRNLVAALLALAVGCASTTSSGAPRCEAPPSTARFSGGAALSVDVADTDGARQQGLMGVTDLPEDQGMAFVWPEPTDATFWMKDTPIPLSIAFVDDEGRVRTVREMTPCEADPCPTYRADGAYTTAIEANAGWFEANGVEPGDRMHLQLGACV
jgi:uncharacterized protein